MGMLFTKVFDALFSTKPVRILILGLDNAGKTTILNHLKSPGQKPVTTIPTIGFNVETLQYKNIKFQMWDLGGQTSIRPYWRCYYPNTDAIIFVVDSTDRERMDIAKKELWSMLEESDLKDAIVLIFANKQDGEGALTAAEVTKALALSKIKKRTWQIQNTNALKGVGLFEGFDWLSTSISAKSGK